MNSVLSPRAFLSGWRSLAHRLRSHDRPLALHALWKLPAAGFAIPFLEGLVGDLAFDEELREFAPLRLALERHVSISFGSFGSFGPFGSFRIEFEAQ